jgi:hypothetical protein
LRRALTSHATIAVVTWLVTTPIAVLATRRIGFSPFTERGAFVPLAAAGAFLAVLCALAFWRRTGEWVAAVAAGSFASWLALTLQVALNGTPFGFDGLAGDMGRLSAAATQYTVHLWPTDSIVDGIPSEYPPLFPWLVGRSALILDVPAWRLLPFAEIGLMSFAVVATFLMWRRLVTPAVALTVSAVGLLVYGIPLKPFSIITLFVFVPWLIMTFADPPRGRLHWLPAGVIGGLIMLTYNGWYPFGLVGILAIMVAGWRRAEHRGKYVGHVLRVGAVALVISAPYLVPYGYAVLTKGGAAVSDLFTTYEITDKGFPFLEPTLLGALELVGLAGLVWYRRRLWWARPMLYLVLGSYVFWLVLGIQFVLNGHTTMFFYVSRLTGVTLAAAGVLTLVEATPWLIRRLNTVAPYRAGVAVLAVTFLWVGLTYWQEWRPRPELGTSPPESDHSNYITFSHLEPLPDCSYPKYAPLPGMIPCLPVNEIRAKVERVLGAGARPHTVSLDERLFAYLPWRGYMGADRTSASSLAYWDDRHAEVARLSRITDPAEFARQSANTRFGPIDVFVLARGANGTWETVGLPFKPEQFDSAAWEIVDDLSQPLVVAVRRG